jgi:hypothetical protein
MNKWITRLFLLLKYLLTLLIVVYTLLVGYFLVNPMIPLEGESSLTHIKEALAEALLVYVGIVVSIIMVFKKKKVHSTGGTNRRY